MQAQHQDQPLDTPAVSGVADTVVRPLEKRAEPRFGKSMSLRLLFFWWVVANIAGVLSGWLAGLGIRALLGLFLGKEAPDTFDLGWSTANGLLSVLEGALLGTAQWVVLRRRLGTLTWRSWAFIVSVSHLASFLLSFLLSAALLAVLNTFVFGTISGNSDSLLLSVALSQVTVSAIFGAMVYWVQSLVLRRHVSSSYLWIMAGGIAALLTQSAEQLLSYFAPDRTVLTMFTPILAPALTAVVTGAFLVLLLRDANLMSRVTPSAALEVSDTGLEPGAIYLEDLPGTKGGRPLVRPARGWKALVGVSIALGALLWFFYCTDYSLPGTLPDIIFPPMAGAIGLAAIVAARNARSRRGRLLARLASLPALVGGVSYVVMAGILFVPPLTLSGMFLVDSIKSETLLQQVPSPDGSRVAEVYYRPGGYAGSYYRPLFVRVTYRWFPLVERDVYRTSVDDDDTSGSYVTWLDNDTLSVDGASESIRLGIVQPETPQIITLPSAVLGVVARQEAQHKDEQVRTAPLKDIPLYPGEISGDNSAVGVDDNAYRDFDILGTDSDTAATWYKSALSKPPWSLVRTSRREDYAETTGSKGKEHLVYNCIEAQRTGGGSAAASYYWSFIWGDQDKGVHVFVETPKRTGASPCEETTTP
jgi:hypothetical protein